MALRDKIKDKVAHQMAPGEQIQAVFTGQTLSQWLLVPAVLVCIVPMLAWLLTNHYRVVVVTDQRILVFEGGHFSQASPSEVVRQFPRATVIGPAGGLWFKTAALGEPLYFHKRFHKDIATADAGIAASA
jgi:hypothetical protein